MKPYRLGIKESRLFIGINPGNLQTLGHPLFQERVARDARGESQGTC